VPCPPSLAGGNFSLTLALPAGSKSYFFRLRSQVTSGTLGGLRAALSARNNDKLSRQIVALAAGALNVSGQVTSLRSAENGTDTDTARRGAIRAIHR